MKVLFINPVNDYWMEAVEKLKSEFPGHEFKVKSDPDYSGELGEADAIVASSLSSEELEKCAKLKIIFVHYAGANAFPLKELDRRNIMLSNVHSNASFVAEHCLRMILVLLGRTVEFHEDLSRDHWHGWAAGHGTSDSWKTLNGMSVSILGTGAIGSALAGYLVPFGCRVTGFRKHGGKKAPDGFYEITTDLNAALGNSELIVNTLPMTAETTEMINTSNIMHLKNSFFINAGRAEIINEKLLFESLRDGMLRGAALDVWYKYPRNGNSICQPSAYPFHTLRNVLLSPHVAGFNSETVKKAAEDTAENIRVYLEKGSPVHTVSITEGY